MWLALVFVLMGSAVHGHRSALALWAVLSRGIRAAMVAWAPLRRHRWQRCGQVLAGFLAISASIVFLSLRDGLAVDPAHDEAAAKSGSR